jgi:hypothetical protein
MKHAMTYTAVIIGLAIGSIAFTAVAQTTANGPYYATPSWDQTLPVATRFIVLSNMNSEAVLDRETGLVWQRSLGALPTVWAGASDSCVGARTGGRMGWRLPTVNELASLFDPSVVTAPFLPSGHPFLNAPPSTSLFWTATPGSMPAFYSFVAFGYVATPGGFILNHQATNPSQSLPYLCVRGGVSPGPQ